MRRMLGGCTRKAIEQVFNPDQIKSTDYNPRNAFINNDPRMKAVLRRFAAKTHKVQEELLVPVEERIQQELFARKIQ